MKLIYHKTQLKRLLKEYIREAQKLECGVYLQRYMFSWVKKSEDKMDFHIKKINELDNKKFKLFSEGYMPQGVFN